MSVTYQLDVTGTNPSNLIKNELHTVQESRFRDYYFIVPNFSPFYVNNFSITLTVNNTITTLVEGVDYSFVMPYITGTRVTGKALYGAITLHNLNMNGILSIKYQTIGGNIVVDRLAVLTMLSNLAYNPRMISFDLVANTPQHFPPTPHQHEYDRFYGQEELVNALDKIKNAILTNSENIATEIHNIFLSLKESGYTMDSTYNNIKKYVDSINSNLQSEILSLKLSKISKSGDIMTGPLTLSGDPSDNLHAATKKYVDNVNTATRQYIDRAINDIYLQIMSFQNDILALLNSRFLV